MSNATTDVVLRKDVRNFTDEADLRDELAAVNDIISSFADEIPTFVAGKSQFPALTLLAKKEGWFGDTERLLREVTERQNKFRQYAAELTEEIERRCQLQGVGR